MGRKIIQDIVVKKKERKRPTLEIHGPHKDFDLFEKRKRKRDKKSWLNPKNLFWLSLVFLIVFSVLTIVNSVSSVTIKVVPKQVFKEVDKEYQFEKGNGFETMELSYEQEQVFQSTGVEKVSEKASGQIVIYNAYSSSPITLIARTRFETPDGKIYRIAKRITIPGAKIENGKIVPSSIEVTVYADKPGEEYNIGLTDFTIPGFKGDPRYEKVYARSKTPMTGGYEGIVSVITENDIINARKTLEEKIKEYLISEIKKQVPDGFILYDDGLILEFEEDKENPSAGDRMEKFKYKLKGKITGFLIEKKILNGKLVEDYLENAKNVEVVNLEKLKFGLLEIDEEKNQLSFSLSGKAHFVWRFNKDELLSSLREVKVKDYPSVFARFPAIENAEVIFKPSWWKKIPQSSKRIHFEEILKNEE